MFVVQPPNQAPATTQLKIFLAGSIEQGQAEDWQNQVQQALNSLDCCLFNPRRTDWDSSWAQSIDHPEFTKQVVWEMERILESDLVIFYFQPGTLSPISVGEFYYAAAMGLNVMVCCPKGFWRKGNIDIVATRHNIRQYDNLQALQRAVINHVRCN
jgi:hypothetical protein